MYTSIKGRAPQNADWQDPQQSGQIIWVRPRRITCNLDDLGEWLYLAINTLFSQYPGFVNSVRKGKRTEPQLRNAWEKGSMSMET